MKFLDEVRRQWVAGAWKDFAISLACGVIFGFVINVINGAL